MGGLFMYTPAKERYETMEYNRCGESGLMLPKVSLGLWHNFGDTSDYENMNSCVLQLLTMASHSLTLPIITDLPTEVQRGISARS